MTQADSQITSCPVCGSKITKLWGKRDQYELKQCDCCQLIVTEPMPTQDELTKFYSSIEYRESYTDSTMSGRAFAEKRYKQLVANLKNKAPHLLEKQNLKLLDVACGDGDFAVIASQNGWDVSATDVTRDDDNPNFENLDITVHYGDFLSLDLLDESFDFITCYHFVEHLAEPNHTLNKIQSLLKPGGVALIETPNIGGVSASLRKGKWSQITPPEHLTYFQPTSLAYALKQANFSKSDVYTLSPLVVKRIEKLPELVKQSIYLLYELMAVLNQGSILQAIAIK